MSKIPYVCLYRSYEEEFSRCTVEEVGELTLALLHYLNTGQEREMTGLPYYFWPRFRSQHDRDAEHYDEVCDANSKNAKKRWDKTKRSHANDAKEKEKENEKEKEKEKECVYSGEHTSTQFSFPSLNDVISFCAQEGLTAMDPQKFYDHNSMMGWTTGGNPIRDWKAAARMWNSKDAARAPKAVEEVYYGTVI